MSQSICNKKIILVGAGGHAKVLMEILVRSNMSILGVVDPKFSIGAQVLGLSCLGSNKDIFKYPPGDVTLVNALGHLPGKSARKETIMEFKETEYEFLTLVHHTAIMADSCVVESGGQIMAGVVVQPDVVIGEHTIINTASSLDHDVLIGSCCHIASGVTISGGVNIGNNVFIGAGTTVTQGVTIGNDVIVGAGSIVNKDVKNGFKLIQKRISY